MLMILSSTRRTFDCGGPDEVWYGIFEIILSMAFVSTCDSCGCANKDGRTWGSPIAVGTVCISTVGCLSM